MAQNSEIKKLLGFKSTEQSAESQQALVDRLMDFGLYPGVEFEVIQTIKFSNVTVIRFHQTLLALNEQEFQCLAL